MASYNAPQENISEFNETLFMNNTPPTSTGGGTGDLTKAQADTYYLSKTTTDTSTAPLTTFQSVDVNSTLKSNNITGIATTGVKSIYTDTTGGTVRISAANGSTYLDANNVYCAGNIYSDTYNLRTTTGGKSIFGNMTSGNLGYGSAGVNNLFYGLSNSFVSGASTDTLSLYTTTGTKNIFTNGIAGAVLNIGSSTSSNTINGNTTHNGNILLGSSNSISSNNYSLLTASGNKNIFTNSTTATINFASSTTTTNFFGVSIFSQNVGISSRLTLKGTQYANENRTISGTSETLTFPLEERIMIKSTGTTAVNITLPLITSTTQTGFQFLFIKTGSITNSVVLTAQGTNQIWPYGTITNNNPVTSLTDSMTTMWFITMEVSAGVFVWREI